MNFKDIFKPPYSTDDYGIYMFDADENICLDYTSDRTSYNGDILKQLCSFLNGDADAFKHEVKEVVTDAHNCYFVLENNDIIGVRGWGYLTGVKHLSNKDAAKLQDDFLDYIVNKIKESQK